MKTISKLTAAIAAATAFAASGAYAFGGVSASATATVISPVTVAQSVGLSFGTFAADPSAPGMIDSSGNVKSGNIAVITPGTPATFTVTGQASTSYTIAGATSVTLNGTNANNPVMTAALTYPNPLTRPLNGSGSDSFDVNGVLTVGNAQAADTYTGTYNVSVHY